MDDAGTLPNNLRSMTARNAPMDDAGTLPNNPRSMTAPHERLRAAGDSKSVQKTTPVQKQYIKSAAIRFAGGMFTHNYNTDSEGIESLL